eukprot:4727752-Pyramimonas_sp.AAC.1
MATRDPLSVVRPGSWKQAATKPLHQVRGTRVQVQVTKLPEATGEPREPARRAGLGVPVQRPGPATCVARACQVYLHWGEPLQRPATCVARACQVYHTGVCHFSVLRHVLLERAKCITPGCATPPTLGTSEY